MTTLKTMVSSEVADILGCSTHRVSWLRQTGLLPGVRFGKRYLYQEEDVERLLKTCRYVSPEVLASMTPEKRKEVMDAYVA